MKRRPGDEKLYSEEEIASILRRSASLQTEVDTSRTAGLTLRELKHIASEVGIDPIHVETASLDLDRGVSESGAAHGSLLLPLTSHETHLIGGEIGADSWEEVVGEIRSLYGDFGTVGQVGSQLNWSRTGFPEPEKQVTVTSRSGRTKVSAHSDYSNLLAFFFPGMFGTSAVVAAVMIETVAASGGVVALVMGMWLVVYYLGARAILRNINRKEIRRAAKLTDRIEQLVQEPESDAEAIERTSRLDSTVPEEVREAAPSTISTRQRTRS